ncbi:hypothetical protein AVEN_214762-1, partial [Araneus ventricosus]
MYADATSDKEIKTRIYDAILLNTVSRCFVTGFKFNALVRHRTYADWMVLDIF